VRHCAVPVLVQHVPPSRGEVAAQLWSPESEMVRRRRRRRRRSPF
jgi:hypothetical protein